MFSSNSFFDKKDFEVKPSTDSKLQRTTSARLSRRISATSIPTQNERPVSVRLRHEPKDIPKIPVTKTQKQD